MTGGVLFSEARAALLSTVVDVAGSWKERDAVWRDNVMAHRARSIWLFWHNRDNITS
jgi:hypothetical protein